MMGNAVASECLLCDAATKLEALRYSIPLLWARLRRELKRSLKLISDMGLQG